MCSTVVLRHVLLPRCSWIVDRCMKYTPKWYIIVNWGWYGNATSLAVVQRFWSCYYTCTSTLCSLIVVSSLLIPYHPVRLWDVSNHVESTPRIPILMSSFMWQICASKMSIQAVPPLVWYILRRLAKYDWPVPPLSWQLLHRWHCDVYNEIVRFNASGRKVNCGLFSAVQLNVSAPIVRILPIRGCCGRRLSTMRRLVPCFIVPIRVVNRQLTSGSLVGSDETTQSRQTTDAVDSDSVEET